MTDNTTDNKSLINTDLKSVLTFRLAQLQNKLNASAIRILKQYSDLSLAEWRILNMVHVWEGQTMSKLVRESSMDKGQVSRNLKNLINKAYVRASISESDARQQNLHLSAKGQKTYINLLPIIRQRQYQLTQGVHAEDLATFNRVLDQLSINVQTMTDAKSDLPTEHNPD